MVWLWVVVALLFVVVGTLLLRRGRARHPSVDETPPAPTSAPGPAVLGEPTPPVVTPAATEDEVIASVETTSTDPELLLEEEATAPAEPEPPASVHGAAAGGPGVAPPPGFTVKGNAGSMLYHTPDSPYFARTRAEVWFNTEEAAREAGFTRWDES